MYKRFFLAPPKARFAQRSGNRIKPIALPCGLNTITPSRSAEVAPGAPLQPQPHHRLPSMSTLMPSIAPGPLASTTLVLFDIAPFAATS